MRYAREQLIQLATFSFRKAGEDLVVELLQHRRQDGAEILPLLRQVNSHQAGILSIFLPPDEAGRLHALDSAHNSRHLHADAASKLSRRQAILTPEMLQDKLLPGVDTVRLQATLEVGLDTAQHHGQ